MVKNTQNLRNLKKICGEILLEDTIEEPMLIMVIETYITMIMIGNKVVTVVIIKLLLLLY